MKLLKGTGWIANKKKLLFFKEKKKLKPKGEKKFVTNEVNKLWVFLMWNSNEPEFLMLNT